jgi:hypothetical protein
VSTLAVSGSTVYVAGSFTSIGGQSRSYLAALDATTGLATAWNPNPNERVNTLLLSGATVYIGGGFTAIGGKSQSGIAGTGDVTTPALLSLVSAEATPNHVRLTWFRAGGRSLAATVYRRTSKDGWHGLQQILGDGTGQLIYDDRQVAPGIRYGYRLGILQGEAEEFLGETWVDVPRVPGLSLVGARPNPSAQDLTAIFSLPDDSPALLEILDPAGRRILARNVGGLGAGSHVVNLSRDRTLRPGVYLLRLAQGSRSLTARAVIIH